MNSALPHPLQDYHVFRNRLPHTHNITDDVVDWLRAVSDLAVEKGLILEWLNLDQVFQLFQEAKVSDVEGPLDFMDVQRLFHRLFSRRHNVLVDQYEIDARTGSKKLTNGREIQEKEFRITVNMQTVQSMSECVDRLTAEA